jgi:hypothetical protein
MLSPPFVPYLGILTRDFVFYGEVNSTSENDPKSLNLTKLMGVGQVIRQIKRMQQGSYPIARNELLQAYIMSVTPGNDDDMYKISCVLEPPE